MIVTCPACSTRFNLDPALLGSEGRKVRCNNCSHIWIQQPPQSVPADMAPFLSGEGPPIARGVEMPSEVRPRGRRRWGVMLGWVLFVIVLAGLAGAIMFGRQEIVAQWPPAERLYALVEMSSELPGAGFELRNVNSTRGEDAGVPLLVVKGELANVSSEIRDVPGLLAVLHDDDGKAIRQWPVDIAELRLLPGEVAQFESSVRNPPGAATRLTIDFTARP